jgi:pyruvate ferredoxin oxidoreductase alpha subunit
MAARDSGFLQLHCATCQEVLDQTLIAYRLAEHHRVRLPVLVNLDGFYLSFTREPVEIPDQAAVDHFLPAFNPETTRFHAGEPVSQGVAVLGSTPYSYFRYENHLAALQGLPAYEEIAAEFTKQFGREYHVLETYRSKDAEFVLFMMGSFATKAKDAVDRMREAGWKVGLVRPIMLRPYPEESLRKAFAGKRGVAVIDQNISMGKGGVLHSELASVLYGHPDMPPIIASFIGGLGGRDIAPEEFFEMVKVLRRAAEEGCSPPTRLLFTVNELREVRKLQAIAHAERKEASK